MTDRQPSVLCIGAANVDVIAHVETGFLLKHRVDKTTSTLIRSSDLINLIGELNNPVIIPGGCAANTACGIGMAGVKVAFAGMIHHDTYGEIFTKGFAPYNVTFHADYHPEKSTSLCLTLVTPDKERSFVFSPDAASWYLKESTLPARDPEAPLIVYTEANLFRMTAGTRNKTMLHAVIDKYRGDGTKIILNLIDTEITTHQRGAIHELIRTGELSYIMCNREELHALFSVRSDDDAFGAAQSTGQTFITTLSRDGAIIIDPSGIKRIEPIFIPYEDIVDMIGAGDQFAAGFISSLAKGKTVIESCNEGIRCASDILATTGARPNKAA